MKIQASILSIALVPCLAIAQPVFLGTNADGIYLAEFDPEEGTLSKPELAAEITAPGFLAIHPEKPILYAVSRGNTLTAFSIGDKNSLTALGEVNTGGKNPTHLSIDATGGTAGIANYSNGSITTISLDADGKPKEVISYLEIKGSGPHPKRQNEPHAHGAYFDSNNQFMFVPDLGIDKTLIYRFDASTSEIKDHGFIASAPGAGPRHMTFSPDGKHAYINNELDNTLLAAVYDPEKGALTAIGTYPTLPADYKGESTTAEVEVHPNGRFVYVSNRGHDSIAVFSRDTTSGELTPLQHAPCGTNIPRHFKIDPSGKWLLCGGQNSNNIAILPLDPETGLLGEPKSIVETVAPICILFP
ncbi:MAG: lactonase family protein [Akkermansiaceae bacterium]|jgi:6-phosphogluconolactonase|nr:lactonase family protein [Akkermansiaceae bacterium]MDP4646788.1 lactonase family protein [Akkermansiaceae bacterium]MDP4720012.1 lactonase family protein [Akkermansiaceae bacterium]MDP4779704.1 lactonase family protein [Akkermansiaceae bacterium]MDP4846637.1 lactonase family protein [Akkermansiaceae bacterium]